MSANWNEGVDLSVVTNGDELIAALDALGPSGRHTKIARFRQALPAIERALARKIPQRQILDELNRLGLSLSIATFKTMLSKERQEQKTGYVVCEHCGSSITESRPIDEPEASVVEPAVVPTQQVPIEKARNHPWQRSF
jgi:hypothetical protein